MRRLTGLLILILFGTFVTAKAALHSIGLQKNLYTSDFMIGDVIVSVIFPESTGAHDPNTETWSEDRKVQVLSEIMAGLDWWSRQNTGSYVSFTLVSETIPTKYEPINRPYYGEALWIPDILGTLGYNGNRFTAARKYLNDLRDQHETDWGFIIFVVDSLNDANGKLADGFFAYAYLGGPYMVMTYDNNGYGINNMDVVAAHETGHIFHALDQYAGASSPSDYSPGYFAVINGNHAFSPTANNPNSIMRGGIRWGLDDWAREMIGWRDLDANGRYDIVDQTPTVGMLIKGLDSTPSEPDFNGETSVSIVPRQGNSQGHGFTVDTIEKVEYRVGMGDWFEAVPADGEFDSAMESFRIVVDASAIPSAQNLESSDIDIRVTTRYSHFASTGPSTPGSAASLANAHAYPNPFKPNSALNHTSITFTDLTPGAKVQIFTAAGNPVYEKTAASSETTIPWGAVTDQGSAVATGVYYYLITNNAGHTKKGKIAVIR